MIRILFICHGNICRSPMAEFVFKDMVRRAGVADRFEIESAACPTDEIGSPAYPPARRELAKHGLKCDGKTARLIRAEDYDRFDLIIGMDRYNLRDMLRRWHNDPDGKVRLLLDYTDRPGDVADPWYTGDFTATWKDITEGCEGLLNAINND
ncbi:MAG: low molecular weight phosphotyrosine protein phosphatase [Clostridia bacterium]|nr:low molecular weight phosphotyrosine protein phosphatase [Clostridia bacterium]